MATVLDALMVTMGVDTTGVKAGMDKAENIISNSAKSIMNNILAPLAAALAIGSAFKEYVGTAQKWGNLAAELGESEEDIQAWAGAVDRAGGSIEGLESTLTNLNSKMLEFKTTGTSSVAPTFARLGISVRNANGGLKSATELLGDLAKVSDKMDAKTFQSLASSMGVDNGTILLLKQGSTAVDELIRRQKALGLYTKEDGVIATKMANAFKDLMQVLKSVSAVIMRIILPPLTFITDKMVDFVMYIRDHETFLKAAIIGITAALTTMLLPAIIGIGKAMLTNPLTWILIGIGALVLSIAAVIEDLYVYMQGGNSALAGFWSKFGSGEEIAKKLGKAWQWLKDLFSSFLKFALGHLKLVFKMIGTVLGILGAFADYLLNIFNLIKSIFTFDGEGIKQAFAGMWEATCSLGEGLLKIGGYIKDMLLNFLEFLGLKDTVLNFFNAIGEKAGVIFGKIKEWLEPIIEGFKSFGGAIFSFFGDSPKASESIAKTNNNTSNVSNSNSNVSVGNVTINTNATDAGSIAKELPNAINGSFNNFALASNSGVSF